MSEAAAPNQPPSYTGTTNTANAGYGNSTNTARNGLGTAALVIGILALLSCWTVVGGIVLGVFAVVFGFIGRSRAKQGQATNGGAALAGIILGGVGLVIALLLIAIGATFFAHHHKAINNLQSCDKAAHSNQSKINSCNQQFNNQLNGS